MYAVSSIWIQLAACLAVLGGACLYLGQHVGADDWLFHGAFCIIASLVAGAAAWRLRRHDLFDALTDLRLVFVFAFVQYLAFGPAVLAFGSGDQVELAQSEHYVDASLALTLDGINSIGAAITLLAACVGTAVRVSAVAETIASTAARIGYLSALRVLWLVAIIGKVRVALNEFASEPELISGLWRVAENVALIAIFASTIYRGRGESSVRAFAIAMSLSTAAIGLLGYNKSAFVFPLLALSVGWAIRRRSLLILASSVAIGFIAVAAVGGTVAFSRGSTGVGASLGTRLDTLTQGYRAGGTGDPDASYSTWNRFNFLNTQGAAFELYESGWGGTDVDMIAWAFVPRVLFSDKPVMTENGTELYRKISGNEGSSVATGIFVDGYYNEGWAGVILGSALCGIILAFANAISRAIIKNNAILLYPIFYSSVIMAYSIGGTILATYIGAFAITIYFCVAVWLVHAVITKRLGTRKASAGDVF